MIDLTKPGPSLFEIDFKVPKSDDSDAPEDAGISIQYNNLAGEDE